MSCNHSLHQAVKKWPDNYDEHCPALCKSTICFSYSALIFASSVEVRLCSCCIGRETRNYRGEKKKEEKIQFRT